MLFVLATILVTLIIWLNALTLPNACSVLFFIFQVCFLHGIKKNMF